MSSQDLGAITKQMVEILRTAKSPVLLPHANPDGDSLGSALGFSGALKIQGITHTVFCATAIPEQFQGLPHACEVLLDHEAFIALAPDVIMTFDASELDRCGLETLLPQLTLRPKFLVVDHHRTFTGFGDVNLVVPDASSTAEVVWRMLRHLNWSFDHDIATSLFQGVVYDTWSFSNLGTTPSSFAVASDLIAAGARLTDVIRATFHNKSVPILQMWGEILQRLRRDPRLNWAVTVITQADLDRYGLSEDEISGLSNFLNTLSDTEAVLILREGSDSIVHGSFRSTKSGVDVSKYAQLFGGGGHMKAAGFKVPGRLVQTPAGTWQIVDSRV